MGTYTTNYNLFMPSIGEQGWGDLVNGNFTTIDTTMKDLRNSVGALETEIGAVEEIVATVEGKLGTGAYIANAKVPIVAKLSTTDEGFGWVSYCTSNLKQAEISYYNSLVGYHIINPTDTYSVDVSCRAGSNGTTLTYSAVSLLTGDMRTLGTIGATSYNTVYTKTFTLYVTEYIQITGGAVNYPYEHSVTAPRIYINSPE